MPSSTPAALFNYDEVCDDLTGAFVLTSLEPPSPASSTGSREVDRSLQTTSQLPASLPMTSPAEPENHCDAIESSRVTPVFKKWFQTRFEKVNKNQASQPADQPSIKSGRPVNSRSQPAANIAQKGPSRFAAGQRARVSVFFGRQQVYGMSDEVSQRSVGKSVDWVRCSVSPLVLRLSCMTA